MSGKKADFDPAELADFDDDPETETVEVTEEVAKRFAKWHPKPPPPPPSALKDVPIPGQLRPSRETLLPSDLRDALQTMAPEDRIALLDALERDVRPEDFGAHTLLPANPKTLQESFEGEMHPSDRNTLFAAGPSDSIVDFYDDDSDEMLIARSAPTTPPDVAPAPPNRPPVTPIPAPDDGDGSSTMVWINKSSTSGSDGKSAQGPGRGVGGIAQRFIDLGLIGVGGMGEVRRIFDRTLKRVLAVKIIRHQLMHDERIVSRFIAEAQATGQLQHPGIVPVHEVGRFADGRYYFTMQEVRGEDLSKVIAKYHEFRRRKRHALVTNEEEMWTLRRMIDAFHKVCEAVGYAHSRHVIHRDLKPENILVGEFGAVLVVDWGIARVMDGQDEAFEEDQPEDEKGPAIVTSRSKDEGHKTMVGSVAGTPAYMPIEQAVGDRDAQGPHSDVYALGAILYEILGSEPPYGGRSGNATLRALIEGPPEPLPEDSSMPEALRQICHIAMAREGRDRYQSARELAAVVSMWLDGAQKREAALQLLSRAEAKRDEMERLRRRGEVLREEAVKVLDDTPAIAPAHEKEPAWASLDRADRLLRGAEMLEVTLTHNARAALERYPELDEAHHLLADVYKKAHEEAELEGDQQEAERALILLRAHHRGRYESYLRGEGAVTLHTDPPGAEVQVFRYVRRGRRLQLKPVGKPHTTPLQALELPMGRYLLSITAEGRIPVRYPVNVGREQHWDGVPPGESEPFPIVLPKTYDIIEGDVYIPAGWFTAGGDRSAPNSADRMDVWVDGFFMQSHPVTVGEYHQFIDHLQRYDRFDEAERYVPGHGEQARRRRGPVQFTKNRHGIYDLPTEKVGGFNPAELPVLMVDWSSAMAYSRWLSDEDGQAWRLPHELEWEKAARGVDERPYPLGYFLDPTWACMGESHREYVLPVSVFGYDSDESPYGVRGLAGNSRDWCRNQYATRDFDVIDGRLDWERIRPQSDGPVYRAIRGGAWGTTADECRSAARARLLQDDRPSDVGFRLVRGLSSEVDE